MRAMENVRFTIPIRAKLKIYIERIITKTMRFHVTFNSDVVFFFFFYLI